MTSEWAEQSFADIPLEIIDGDRGKNYPKQDEFVPEGHCLFLNAGNVTNQGFNFTNCMFIDRSKDSVLRQGKLSRFDVVLTTRGTVGNSAFYDASVEYDHIRINSGMVILRANNAQIWPRFLYLFVRSKLFSDQVAQLRTGSAQPQLPIRDIRRIKVALPPLAEQQAIACILGALDDKIEVNRRMNGTLEAMARALFQDWFVDFGPVRAKAAGQAPAGLSEAVAALFPDRLVEVAGREVPEGWEIKILGDVLELAYGKALKADVRKEGTVAVYGSNGQVGWHNESLVSGPGIVVGRKGNPGIVTWAPNDFYPIDTTFYVVPKTDSLHFLYYSLQRQGLPALSADSAVPGLNRNIAYMNKIVMPNPELIEAFETHAGALMERISRSNAESQRLSALRDTLLPKLIAGELRVRNAERIVARCS